MIDNEDLKVLQELVNKLTKRVEVLEQRPVYVPYYPIVEPHAPQQAPQYPQVWYTTTDNTKHITPMPSTWCCVRNDGSSNE